jgi:hypothetical protein
MVQCRGTPDEIGQHQGRVFATSRRGLNFRRSKVGLPSWFDMHAEERFYAKFAPAMLDEIAGIANALDTSLERACLFYGNGGLPGRGRADAPLSCLRRLSHATTISSRRTMVRAWPLSNPQ